jgi:hypothetical protein
MNFQELFDQWCIDNNTIDEQIGKKEVAEFLNFIQAEFDLKINQLDKIVIKAKKIVDKL